MKKASFVLMAMVLVLGALAACGPTPEPQIIRETVPVEVTKVVKEEVQVEVTTVVKEEVQVEVTKEVIKETQVEKDLVIYNSMHSDPEPREMDAEQVAAFEAANPDIDIVHSTVAHEDFKQAIRAYLTASTPPDVMTWFAGNRARFFIDKGLIMDISDVWESEGWNEDFPAGFRALSTVDGKQYFLPSSWYWWAVYYRKDIFEQYGLEPPETWEEFLQVCETLKENGITPITIGTKYRWTAAPEHAGQRSGIPHRPDAGQGELRRSTRAQGLYGLLGAADRERLLYRGSGSLYVGRSDSVHAQR